jgi:hypothetical protein
MISRLHAPSISSRSTSHCPAHSWACCRLQYKTVRPSPLQLTLLVACRTCERYTVSTMTARENNAYSWQCDPMMTYLTRVLVLAAPVSARSVHVSKTRATSSSNNSVSISWNDNTRWAQWRHGEIMELHCNVIQWRLTWWGCWFWHRCRRDQCIELPSRCW